MCVKVVIDRRGEGGRRNVKNKRSARTIIRRERDKIKSLRDRQSERKGLRGEPEMCTPDFPTLRNTLNCAASK